MQPYYENNGVTIYHGDCIEVMQGLEDNSINLIAEDPPYFKVRGDHWDNAWDTADGFIEWLDTVLKEQARLLVFNGSQYTFASPQMAARVEVKIAERFNVLNHIVWRKYNDITGAHNSGQWSRADKSTLRAYFPQTERIIFAEHYNSDNTAKGEAGYALQCDKLRGFVFEPLRAYFDGERVRAGVSNKQIQEWFAAHGLPRYMTARHTFTQSQWEIPTPENYEALRMCFAELGNGGGDYLRREYEDLRREYEDLRREYEDLRREYEDLRREYEDLRRPFSVSTDVPYTDVWDFRTVPGYPGKHACEKPLDLMEHIIRTSSRDGDVILDPFMGSGSTLVAARRLGRRVVGVDFERKYCDMAIERLERDKEHARQLALIT